jgi:hypothetical protein
VRERHLILMAVAAAAVQVAWLAALAYGLLFIVR